MGGTVQKFNEWFVENADRRTDNIFLVSSPIPAIVICSLYLLFVKKWGPKWMENKKPFRIEKIMILYNVIQVLANTYLAGMTLIHCIPYYNVLCTAPDYSNGPQALLALRLTYLYYILKISDLLDTVFFTLRKKNNQVSFLHVYHHCGMVLSSWFAARYVGGGHTIYVGFLNCTVHMFMYFYYLLTAWNSEYKKSVWWKKHITQLQLIQFFLLMIIFSWTLRVEDCLFPKSVVYFFFPQNFIMVYMFGKFYWNTYINPSSNTTNPKTQKAS